MAQNALELYKYIKSDPSLKLDLTPNYLQRSAEQQQEYYNSPSQEENYFQPVEIYGQGGAYNQGSMFRGGVQAEIPYGEGTFGGGLGAAHLRDKNFSQNYLTHGNVFYDNGPYSVSGEYQNNPVEYAPLFYEMEGPTNYLGQNYLGRAKIRY